MKKFVYILIMPFILSSCYLSAAPASLDTNPPPGPPEYQKGWKEGCESGISSYSTNTYKVLGAWRHQYYLDYTMIKNKMYYKAWNDAFLYCAQFIEKINVNNNPTI